VGPRIEDGVRGAGGGRRTRGLGGHVCVCGQSALVEPFCGLDDLVELARDLRRGHAAAKDILCGDGGAVEFLVRVLPLDQAVPSSDSPAKRPFDLEYENMGDG